MIVINVDKPINCNQCILRPICPSRSKSLWCNCIPDNCPIVFDLKEWLSSFNTESATVCFTEIQELKKKVEKENE